jgi:AcrR family transcriptional regulator
LSTARLLAAAAELFAERGYRQTTLAEIGERAGYSYALISRRFGSKHALLVSLLDHMIDDWLLTLVPALGDKTGVAGIRASYDAFCANARANATNLRALESLMFEGLWGEPELRERLSAHQANAQAQYREIVERGLADGSVRPVADADAVALMASAALRGATYRWLLEDDFDLCGALTAFADVLEVLLRPEPA